MTTIIASMLIAFNSQDSATRMVDRITALEPLVCSVKLKASAHDIWNAWTTGSEISKWMVASGTVDLRIGGLIRTSYEKGSDLTGPSVIENEIIAYDPDRMLAIKNKRAPDNFPFKAAIAKTWTVIYIQPQGDETEVTVRMMGWDYTEDSQTMKGFFKSGNQSTLDSLAKYFSQK